MIRSNQVKWLLANPFIGYRIIHILINLGEQFFQKKKAKTNQIVALKALSCKIAKGCYHVLSKGVPFDEEKLFA